MLIMGVDLSGPANHSDTAVALFQKKGSFLSCLNLKSNVSDNMLLQMILDIHEPLVIGFDAPLSYNDGGGDRKADRLLRDFIKRQGMHHGSIMTPTLTKMVYLTLRGISLTRMIESLSRPIQMVETHPGAAMFTRLTDTEKRHALLYKKEAGSKEYLMSWLDMQGLENIPWGSAVSPHMVDACAAALAAWCFEDEAKKTSFFIPADPPSHPYVLCC